MTVLSFTLSPEAVGKFHDALVCLGKFSENVSLEATQDTLLLTTLNSSKTGYASFTLGGNTFFQKYAFNPLHNHGTQATEKFACKLYNKALLSIFRGRPVDPLKERETAVERCDVVIEDGDDKVENRIIIKMFSRHGVLKTFRLTFEACPRIHALFVEETAKNRWSISSRPLRELIEHFGPGAEQLDFYFDDGHMSLTSFTEKIVSNNEVLKQPLHTTVALDALEFSDFSVVERLHIVISVKDFKSIIAHAGITNTVVNVAYSYPANPMKIAYDAEGIMSEFIVMTIGEPRRQSEAPAQYSVPKRPPTHAPLKAAAVLRQSANSLGMVKPSTHEAANTILQAGKRAKISQPSSPHQPTQSQLFFPDADDDRRWDPVDYDNEDEPNLLWDANNNIRGIFDED